MQLNFSSIPVPIANLFRAILNKGINTDNLAPKSVTTSILATDSVDKTIINANVAGNGLGQNADGSLEVNVDNSTIEINSDALRVKTVPLTTNVSGVLPVANGGTGLSSLYAPFKYMEMGYAMARFNNPKLLFGWLTPSDGGTEIDQSSAGNNASYVAGTGWSASSMSILGFVNYLKFNGTSNYLTVADSDDLSFGSGTAGTDVAFTITALVRVATDGTNQHIIAKHRLNTGAQQREWIFRIDSDNKLQFTASDESANVGATRESNSVISNGWHMVAVTYDPALGSGATFATGVKLYVDGVVVASTATNSASYVAMENTACPVSIGASRDASGTYSSFWKGDMGCIAISKETLSVLNIWRLYLGCRGYYNL